MASAREITITLGANKRVAAQIGDHLIHTDQPAGDGGDNSAPSPYLLFLAAIGTCAGFYVSSFLESRGLPKEGVQIRQGVHRNPENGKLEKVDLTIDLPASIPQKYHDAIVRAADQCTVKKALQDPPRFEVTVKVTT